VTTDLGTLSPNPNPGATTNGVLETTLTSTTPGTATVTAHLGDSATDPVIGTAVVEVASLPPG
jgi:hypothetical protein